VLCKSTATTTRKPEMDAEPELFGTSFIVVFESLRKPLSVSVNYLLINGDFKDEHCSSIK